MNVFIGIATLLTLLVIAWLVRPLLRTSTPCGISSNRLNAAIHRDQLVALEADLARGAISQQDFEATRDELQLRLLDDTQSFEAVHNTPVKRFWTGQRTALVIALSTPVIAVGFYLQLGAPSAINPPPMVSQVTDPQILKMVTALETRMKDDPGNLKGWVMLARTYKAIGRLDESVQAYEKAGKEVSSNPDLLIDYAEVLGMQAGNQLSGKPSELINAALKLNPLHPMGLMMAGVVSFEQSDFAGAVAQWQKLLTLVEPNSEDAQQINANIEQARSKGGMAQSSPAAPSTSNSSNNNSSNSLPPVPAGAAAGMTPEKINEMVDRLAARLKNNPDDLAGWARLARAYKVQGRLDEAEQAYKKTGKLLDTDPDLLTQYADLLATRNSGFKGKATELIDKALTIAPNHPMALMMAGQAAFQAAQYPKAVAYWERVLAVLPAGSSDATMVKSEITDAKAKMAAK